MESKNKPTAQPRPNVRALALEVIIETIEHKKFLDVTLHEILEKVADFSKTDRAFLTRLCEGTLERCIELDYILNQFSKTPVSKMKPQIRCILRMSVYQFMYMDVPNRAACDEAVKLVVKRKMHGLKGFVNGVLRNIDRNLGQITYPDPSDFPLYLSVKYSMPQWIVSHFLDNYPKETVEKMLSCFLDRQQGVCVRVNTNHDKYISSLQDSLKAQNIHCEPGNLCSDALYLSGFNRLEDIKEFRQGRLQVQAESSMMVGKVSGIKPGQQVLDVCAAPGGKSIHAADLLAGSGRVISCDISAQKVSKIQENITRTHASQIEAIVWDATVFRKEWAETMDVIIADLPCSGLGVLGKKSDIKYRVKPQDLPDLVALQKQILQNVIKYLKPGGTLVYSTCTINKSENEQMVSYLKEEFPLHSVSIEENLPIPLMGRTGKEGYLQILPTDGTDGFFVAKFKKKDK